ncbi:MAG: hypothetical protein B7X03_01070 [Parcubacteria group bacterium 21-58-10]|nr:MAG: hypothetical protein B7X03_01070 [Parcubacteria group bacterium 21-58-10]
MVMNVLTSLAPRIPTQEGARRNLIALIVGLYYISLLVIVFSPGNMFVNVGIAVVLHFIVNPLVAILREKTHGV